MRVECGRLCVSCGNDNIRWVILSCHLIEIGLRPLQSQDNLLCHIVLVFLYCLDLFVCAFFFLLIGLFHCLRGRAQVNRFIKLHSWFRFISLRLIADYMICVHALWFMRYMCVTLLATAAVVPNLIFMSQHLLCHTWNNFHFHFIWLAQCRFGFLSANLIMIKHMKWMWHGFFFSPHNGKFLQLH